MYYEPEYAAHFVALWQRIAARFAKHGDVIYGFKGLDTGLTAPARLAGCCRQAE